MEKKKLNLAQQIENFKKGDYNLPDVSVQVNAGWWDWFCKDSSLMNKTISLYKKVISISESQKIDLKNTYVFFKNNCPVNGSLYDDFRICDLGTGKVIFTVTPKSGHTVDKGVGEVWGKENDFSEPLFKGTWKEIKKWFNS